MTSPWSGIALRSLLRSHSHWHWHELRVTSHSLNGVPYSGFAFLSCSPFPSYAGKTLVWLFPRSFPFFAPGPSLVSLSTYKQLSIFYALCAYFLYMLSSAFYHVFASADQKTRIRTLLRLVYVSVCSVVLLCLQIIYK